MKRRSAIKTDLFAGDRHREKIDDLGDPLQRIERHIDFVALAQRVDQVAPRPVSLQGGRPAFPTETMVRILLLKRLYNLSDEQMEWLCCTNQIRVKRPQPRTELPYANRFRYPELREAVQ